MVEKRPTRALTARQAKFVEAVADPLDRRSIGAKAMASGLSESYGFKAARRPHIAAAIERRVDDHVRLLRARISRVLTCLADAAERGDTRAASVFLEAVGMIGNARTAVAVHVNTAEIPLQDRIREYIKKRDEQVTALLARPRMIDHEDGAEASAPEED